MLLSRHTGRRSFILALAAATFPEGLFAEGAHPVRRIGVLLAGWDDAGNQANLAALREGLKERGPAEGRSSELIIKYALGDPARLATLASELVEAGVDVIVTSGTPPIQAAQRATSTIPIVMAMSGDPVGAGLVWSLREPGGNTTGFSLIATDLAAKRLEVLKECFPQLTRLGILTNPENASLNLQVRETELAAPKIGIEVRTFPARTLADLHRAIDDAAATSVNAIATISDPIQFANRKDLVEYAGRHRLPVVGEFRELAEAGALLSYGPNRHQMWKRAAEFVTRILAGTRPAQMPVEQPTAFELVLNARTANTLGLTIPPTLLARADEVIE
jgi:putative ABC transport system substrate-binding protein